MRSCDRTTSLCRTSSPTRDPPRSETRLPHAGGTAQSGRQDVPVSPWKTPWSEAGLPEPGWWKAFAVDKNVRSTRTPRRVTADQARGRRQSFGDRRGGDHAPSSPRKCRNLALENPVANRIADLRSAFRAVRGGRRGAPTPTCSTPGSEPFRTARAVRSPCRERDARPC